MDQLEPVVDSDALLPCAPRAPATRFPFWPFFRVIVLTEVEPQGFGPEGFLAALFPLSLRRARRDIGPNGR